MAKDVKDQPANNIIQNKHKTLKTEPFKPNQKPGVDSLRVYIQKLRNVAKMDISGALSPKRVFF